MSRSGPVPLPAVPLSDGVVVLRARRVEDVAATAAASHDPETLRWLKDPPMDAAARASALERTERLWRTGEAAPLVIADAAADHPMGMINLRFADDREASVAYNVFPEHRGRGVASRAVELVAGWAFGQLGLERLVLEADPANTASVRVAQRTGFTPAGSRVDDGTTLLVFRREPGTEEHAT
jgi:RimJ/RimL family protein N-acetyltransferase